MKLGVGYGSQTYKHAGILRWYHKDAKNIKRGIVYRHKLSPRWTSSVDPKEIYMIKEKDRISYTHWLVEHKILASKGKLEFIPLQQVYMNESVDGIYWTIKLSEYKTIFTPKEIDEFYKKLKLEKKKKLEEKKNKK